jgi:integrase
MKLNHANLAKLRSKPLAEGKKEERVFDDDLQGFGVRIRAGAHSTIRTWIIQYRVRGKHQQTTATLGPLDKLSPGVARERAKQDLAQAQLGVDPQAKKNENRVRSKETFGVVADRYLEYKRKGLRVSSYEQIETHLADHWKAFRSRPIHEITRRDIALELGKIGEGRGPYAANRARGTLSALFSWAMSEAIVEANPVIGTNRQTDEKSRDRVLTDAELLAIWKACNADDYGNIVRLLILTGQRRDEVGAIARSEIDPDARKWTIPALRTKNGLVHEVPLSHPALKILKQALAREGREDRERIFGEANSGAGFSGWSKAKAALDERIKEARKKVAPWRLHDLRRTVATRMADLAVLPHVVEACLNHISGHKAGIAGVYNKAAYSKEKAQAFDILAAHIEALLAGKPGSNITLMRKA